MERSPKCTNLDKWSFMVRMVVLPDEGGRPVTKSKTMWDHGLFGVGRGRIRPAGRVFGTLFCAQTKQAVTYSCVSVTKEGQQNRCWRNWRVILTWVAGKSGCVCPVDDLASDTRGNLQTAGGSVPELVSFCCASQISFSISQVRLCMQRVGWASPSPRPPDAAQTGVKEGLAR